MTTPTTEPTKEAIAVGAFLSAMHDQGLDGAKVREAMLDVLGPSAALQARNQQGPIKTWQERLEETCPAIGPMHIHACVEEINDAMQAEIDDLRAALQAREGEAVTGWDNGLSQDYDKNLGRWFADRPGARQQLRETFASQPAQPESIECDCGRIHKKTRYGWACSEPAQPEQGPPT